MDAVFDIRGSSCLISTPSGLSRAVLSSIAAFTATGASIRAPQFFRTDTGHRVEDRPLATPFALQISFMQELRFVT